jgi:DNA helicase II / ATP-dependent DNA helicase PcrA
VVAYESLTPDQRAVVDAKDPISLVLGGAGVGKTTTALWAARRHLMDDPNFGRRSANRRALFVTFSRTAVSQIQGRSAGVVEGLGDQIEVLTFHGLAYKILRSFGRFAGLDPKLTLQGSARGRLLGSPASTNELTYDQLLPLTLRLLRTPSPIADILRSRWSLVVCDEFQDTGHEQWELLTLLMTSARLLLLADPNQMIFGFLDGVSDTRLDVARAVPGCVEVTLPLASHRDPTQALPSAATEIRWRRFTSTDVAQAMADGRIKVRSDVPDDDNDRAMVIAHEIAQMRQSGHESFGVFTKTNNDAVGLSVALTAAGLPHVPIGFAESYGESLGALMAITNHALGYSSWEDARTALAVAITASDRTFKQQPPPLAQAIHRGQSVSPTFDHLMHTFQQSLGEVDGSVFKAVEAAVSTWSALSFAFGSRAWKRAALSFQAMAQRAALIDDQPIERLRVRVEQARTASFIELDGGDSGQTQLMNFSQTKGREADAVLLSFRSDDYFGSGHEPFDEPSRLLYVALTRARRTAVVLLPTDPHALVAPLLKYA